MVSGGVSKFAKARPDATFQKMVKEAFDYALGDVPRLTPERIDGSVGSYFSDHFTRQLMAGIMVTDYLGLCPKPNKRIEGGGATGGLSFQAAGRRWHREDELLRGLRLRNDVPRADMEGERVHRARFGHELRLPRRGFYSVITR